VAIVMVIAVSSSGHVEGTMVPMPMSDIDSDWTDSNFDVFRHDHRFVAGAQRAGKCRHR
jgi:hypothetical protein